MIGLVFSSNGSGQGDDFRRGISDALQSIVLYDEGALNPYRANVGYDKLRLKSYDIVTLQYVTATGGNNRPYR